MLNWDDLNFFGAIASERSFRKAATRLNLSVNTIRARIGRLEQALGTVLFHRGREGLSLSADGVAVLGIVLEMDATSRRLVTRGGAPLRHSADMLTIGCSEGVGEFWLVPQLPALQRQVPVNVSFLCETDQDRIHSAERDICIGFARPTHPETIVCKLATLHFVLCASKSYLERFGRPDSSDDFDGHRFIVHDSYGLTAEAMQRLVGESRAHRLISGSTNGGHALLQAIASGAGIGALPAYLCGLSSAVEPLDLPIRLSADLWLSFNRSSMSSQANRDAIDWVKGCFRSPDHPWFGDDFVRPHTVGTRGGNPSTGPEAYVGSLVPAAGIEPAAP